MKRLIRMFLVLGAVIGLFGQGLALAYAGSSPAMAKIAMADDCMSDMKAATAADGSKPCKGMTLACIAAMGCTIPLVVPADHVFAGPVAQSAPIHGRGASTRLTGRELAPEPDPPSLS